MAKRGQEEYDELSKKYRDEKERQLSALEQQVEQRRKRRQEVEEQRIRELKEQQERDRLKLEAELARRRSAQERLQLMRTQIHSRKRLFFKGGFSQAPLEPFNRVQEDMKQHLASINNEARQRAHGAVLTQKVQEILNEIDKLDMKIRNDTKVLKRGPRDDFSDVRSTRSRGPRKSALGRRANRLLGISKQRRPQDNASVMEETMKKRAARSPRPPPK
jgi:hypothetical protein